MRLCRASVNHSRTGWAGQARSAIVRRSVAGGRSEPPFGRLPSDDWFDHHVTGRPQRDDATDEERDRTEGGQRQADICAERSDQVWPGKSEEETTEHKAQDPRGDPRGERSSSKGEREDPE